MCQGLSWTSVCPVIPDSVCVWVGVCGIEGGGGGRVSWFNPLSKGGPGELGRKQPVSHESSFFTPRLWEKKVPFAFCFNPLLCVCVFFPDKNTIKTWGTSLLLELICFLKKKGFAFSDCVCCADFNVTFSGPFCSFSLKGTVTNTGATIASPWHQTPRNTNHTSFCRHASSKKQKGKKKTEQCRMPPDVHSREAGSHILLGQGTIGKLYRAKI